MDELDIGVLSIELVEAANEWCADGCALGKRREFYNRDTGALTCAECPDPLDVAMGMAVEIAAKLYALIVNERAPAGAPRPPLRELVGAEPPFTRSADAIESIALEMGMV